MDPFMGQLIKSQHKFLAMNASSMCCQNEPLKTAISNSNFKNGLYFKPHSHVYIIWFSYKITNCIQALWPIQKDIQAIFPRWSHSFIQKIFVEYLQIADMVSNRHWRCNRKLNRYLSALRELIFHWDYRDKQIQVRWC